MGKKELLMPAGSFDALKTAVVNGADAVYFGSNKFNARISAQNFGGNALEDLKEAIDFTHLYKKKAYLTINTLLKDSEMKEAIELAKNAFEFGIDAIIVQDLGFLQTIKKLIPKMEIHASTQLTCHNLEGAIFLAKLGVKRIVFARELSLKEIKEISLELKKIGVETEAFVHGAMCFSYSGQCLFSSFAFNKSGNRGMCLQPCRMEYILEEEGEKRKGFFLSMKDQMNFDIIKELEGAGVDSFKVEGRLKGVEYIYAVAKTYRKAIDNKKLSEEDIKLMKIAFMREPSHGYWLEEKEKVSLKTSARKGILGAKVNGFKGKKIVLKLAEDLLQWDSLSSVKGDKVNEFKAMKIFKDGEEVKKANKGSIVEIEVAERPFLEKGQELFITTMQDLTNLAYASIANTKKISYQLEVIAEEGKELYANISFEGKQVSVKSGFVLEQSSKQETSADLLKSKLFKQNNFFSPDKFNCIIKGKPFVPLSVLKKFKNTILLEAREKLFEEKRRHTEADFEEKKQGLFEEIKKAKINSNKVEKQSKIVFTESNFKEIGAIDKYADEIVFYESKGNTVKKFFVKSSNIQSDSEIKKFFSENEKNRIVCSNLGAIQKCITEKKDFITDREINAMNSFTIKMLLENGAKRIVPSVELSLEEIFELSFREKLLPLVYFYPLLMTSKAYANSASLKEGVHTLKDRKDFEYKTVFSRGLFRLYNPVPVDMLFELENFSVFNAIGIDLNATSAKEALDTINYAAEKAIGKKAKKTSKFTRGHYEKPVY